MGKKYIVEIKEGERLYKTKLNALNEPVIREIICEPYTEPDLDAIRNEAYEKGVQDTKQHWVDAPRTCAYKLGYDNGLNDAWEAARKIANIPYAEEEKVFGSGGWNFILNHTAQDAIDRLKAYEQKKQEEIKVGDEVIAPMGVAVITEITDERFHFIHADGSYGFDYKKDAPRKTGRHFPEIATVLQKMREGNDNK